VGDVVSVDFHEYLDTSHGADYFRRWHHLKENSGTLLCHKASHHFDQVNWWLGSRPVEVSAWGELRFYGRNHSFRGTHCRSCPFREQCAFQWDLTRNPDYVKLYAECESEDGYLRDACVWRENTNIYDVMSVRVRYENGVLLTYSANTYLPYEGQSISFNGTKGRLELQAYGGGGFRNQELRLSRSFGRSEVVRDLDERLPGGHGGADTSIRNLIFRNAPASDPLGLRADVTAGALSSLVGIGAYRSIERGGAPLRIADLARV
jgi:predicted dehydrogenase